jgi:phosphohistidine phosphatase SixA
MKILAFIRHGAYYRTRENGLSEEGRQQMQFIGKVIKNYMGKLCPVILSSLSPRGRESAEIIRKELDCSEVKPTDAFGLAEGYMINTELALDTIRAQESSEAVIVVTHHDCFEKDGAAYLYSKDVVGVPRFPPDEIRNGDAVLIDVESRNATYLPYA